MKSVMSSSINLIVYFHKTTKYQCGFPEFIQNTKNMYVFVYRKSDRLTKYCRRLGFDLGDMSSGPVPFNRTGDNIHQNNTNGPLVH